MFHSARHVGTTEFALSGTKVFLSRAERSLWRDKGCLLGLTTNNRNTSYPIEECVRCLRCETGRISQENISL